MQKKFLSTILITASMLATPVMADEPHKQCQMIAALTGDYYAQRLAGKDKAQIQHEIPLEFMNSDFLRLVDLAINLAFSVELSLNEDQVETQVYDSCVRHSP